MTKFVVDTSAWIEYLEESEKGRKFSKIIENGENELFTSCSSVAEIITKFLKSSKETSIALDCIHSLSNVIDADEEISILSGQIHFEEKKKNKDFGMLDAFVAATAKTKSAKILTSDNNFKNFKEAVIV